LNAFHKQLVCPVIRDLLPVHDLALVVQMYMIAVDLSDIFPLRSYR